MKLAIATLLSTLLLAVSVKADITPTPQYVAHWTFTELIGYHYEDYSTNLGIPLGATLPVEAVKAGWACTRLPTFQEVIATMEPGSKIVSTPTYEIGVFRCSNGWLAQDAQAACALDKINTDYNWLDIKLPGASDGIRFSVSCAALPQ
jgi:hypothetical protein